MNKMDESDLLRFLEAEAAAAYHHVSGDLAAEREKGLLVALDLGSAQFPDGGFVELFGDAEGELDGAL